MKRRDTFRLIPLSIAGMAGMAQNVFAEGVELSNGISQMKEPLAIQYTKKVRDILWWIRRNQSAQMMEAAYVIARTVKNGGQCWSNWNMGHNLMYDLFEGRCGEPEIFTVNYDSSKAKKGDLLLVTHYGDSMQDVLDKGVFVIGGPDPYSLDGKGDDPFREDLQDRKFKPYSHLWVDTNVTRRGAIMDIPGSTVRCGPVSGILGMTSFWMMVADACRILAREGISVQVKGDEPKLVKEEIEKLPKWERNSPINLDEPLMYEYFDRLLEHIEQIGAELGKIRQIAEMVVDTALSGGNVYCYSRYRNQLAVEGNTRRGGLAMFNGIFDGGAEMDFNYVHAFFEGRKLTGKDCVVMGFTKPDDEVDLDNFDKFRKFGMRIASIGPKTRDFKIPELRTIPMESDVHLGNMCDSYGLFAIPGFERKVCPTSGALVNQMYWATCMEIVEQFIERTNGDVPGIFANVAIKGGREQMRHLVELYRERGY